jgi:EAL and modified HD-GYP domain-containing signal transduction protein
MATQPHRDMTADPSVLVSRQPVLDARDQVVGYRVSYSVLSNGSPVVPTGEDAISIVDDVLSVIDHDEQVLGNKAHLSFPRELLLAGDIPQIRPERVLLRIAYEDAISDPLIRAIREAANRGFELELDGLPGPAVDPRLLEHFSAIEIDLSRWDAQEAAGMLTRMQGAAAHGLAAGVKNHSEREAALRLGFQWFTGPFFATPKIDGGGPIPIGDLHTVIGLCKMQSRDASLEDLIEAIEQEVGLGVRLLKYMNSAYFGFSGRVRSIQQAATMLGTRGLSRWALTVASLSGPKPIPRELALMTLTRARACELVGLDYDEQLDSDELFTVGMLSTSDAVFRMPMARVIQELPLADQLSEALLHGTGAAGEILQSVISFESGEFQAPTLRSSLLRNSVAYREALDWARRAIYGMA